MHTILITKRWTPAPDWTVDCSLLATSSGSRRWEVRQICQRDGKMLAYGRLTYKTRHAAMQRVRTLCQRLETRA